MDNEVLLDDYPLVCICIAVRNGEKTILETLNSLIKQDYPNYEILICDNLSTDNTKRIIDEIAVKSVIKIRYLLNTQQGSAEANWNFLLRSLPSGIRFFGLYHADDIYDQTIISKEMDLIIKTQVGAVFTQSRLIDADGKDVTKMYNHKLYAPREITSQEVFNYDQLLYYTYKYHNIIRTPSFFFRRDILDGFDCYFDAKFQTSADLDFWLRIAKEYKIAIVNEPLLGYRISKDQGSYTLLRNREEPGDFYNVMDYHLQFFNDRSTILKWYNAHKSMELIFCSINLIKNEKRDKALKYLNQAISIQNLPVIINLRHGAKTYFFGIALRISITFNFQKSLIKLINY